MTIRFLQRIPCFLLVGLAALGLIVAVSPAAVTGARSLAQAVDVSNPGVFPPQSRPYGLTYNEWSARWWQWAFSLPIDKSPLFGTADCSEGQSGPVWFLPGATVGGPTPRQDCTVPPGKALLVSIINAECSNLEGSGTTEPELRGCADFIGTLIDPTSLHATLDGRPLNNLPRFQVESPLFHFGPLPDNNLITYFCVVQGEGCPAAPQGSIGIAVGVGVYVMLEPLSVGTHELRFHGEIPAAGFVIDTTYHITVKP
jgi:hypothetical protein